MFVGPTTFLAFSLEYQNLLANVSIFGKRAYAQLQAQRSSLHQNKFASFQIEIRSCTGENTLIQDQKERQMFSTQHVFC